MTAGPDMTAATATIGTTALTGSGKEHAVQPILPKAGSR